MSCSVHKILLYSILFLIARPTAFGQTDSRSFSDYSALIFDQIQTNVVVRSASRDTWKIMQDSQGFLWFSSVGGLHRYDGFQFKNFYNNIADSTSLPPHRVWEMEEDKAGNIWVATHGGLRIFDPRRERFDKLYLLDSVYLGNEIIYNIIRDKRDRMWVTTRGHGFFVFDTDQDTVWHFQHDASNPTSLSNDIVVEIIEDQKGRYWIATMWGGLNRLDSLGGPFTRYTHDPNSKNSIPSNSIMYVFQDSDGKIWLTTWNGVCTIDPETEKIRTYRQDPEDPTSLAHNRTWHVTEDSNKHIWIATSGGLSIFDKTQNCFNNYTHDPFNDNGISDNYIRFSFEDQDGNIWLTSANGINKVDLLSNQFSFAAYRRMPGSSNENPHDGISAILQDSQGRLWVGTNGGGIYLQEQEGQPLRLFKDASNALSSSVWHLFEDQDGRILAATHAGVLLFNEDSDQFEMLYTGSKRQLITQSIRKMIQPTSDEIWMVGDDGLFILHSKLDTFYQKKGKLDVLTTIFEDSKGGIWLGSEKGLQFIHPDTTISYFHTEVGNPNSLSHNAITAIAEDQLGNIWVTTNQGLNQLRFSGDSKIPSIKRWDSGNTNLPTNELKDVFVDHNNQIYLLTPREIVRFNPEKKNGISFSALPPSDVITSKFSSSQQGKWYFGGYWGIYSFHPKRLTENSIPPRITITDFKLFNESVPIRGSFADTLAWRSPLEQSILFSESITLKHWQNDFSFEFTALNFPQSYHSTFLYQLEGYDKNWISPATDYPIASYTNIPPGQYTFRVTTTINSDSLKETSATFSLNILAPWYWAWWSKILYTLLLLSILYSFYHIQLKRRLAQLEAGRLRELDSFKSQFFIHITHEFRTPLTIIMGIAEQLRQQVSEHAKESLSIIRRNGQQLLKLVNQMLDLSKLESGHLQLNMEQRDVVQFLKYVFDSFQYYAESQHIQLHFHSNVPTLFMDFDAARLSDIISNLLSNAIKFTHADGKVEVLIQTVKKPDMSEVLEIIVKDSGIGIPQEVLPFIFNRFYQVQSAEGTSQIGNPSLSGGIGIGLALTKNLVRLMGGTIQVESTVGSGSIFSLQLPITTSQAVRKTPDQAFELQIEEKPKTFSPNKSTQQNDKSLILLVEDNLDLVSYMIDILRPQYNLVVAYDGQAGIDKAIELIPDLIISDVMMPIKDGLEVCRAVKKHRLTCHIPVIMLTAKVDIDSRLTGLQQGAEVYLAKPFLQAELEIHINNLLQQRRQLQTYYQKQWGITAAATQKYKKKEKDVLLENVDQYILTNLDNHDLSVEQMGRALFVSVSNLYRKTKALTGMGPSQYIRHVRIAVAKEKLRYTDVSITQIADQTGFKDVRYFSRVFKMETGITPTEFRNEKNS